MIRVGVFGAAGRMGATVCQAVAADAELELVAAVDLHHEGLDVRAVTGAVSSRVCGSPPTPRRLGAAGAEVAVDFTVAGAARANAEWCAAQGIHAVIGTTGFDESDLDALRTLFGSSNCLVAPNFAIGAVLMIRFAELAAPFFDSAEIIELHHDAKTDAPSGTALHTATRMAARLSQLGADATAHGDARPAPGRARPGRDPHALRPPAGPGGPPGRGAARHHRTEHLSIRHDSYDRTSFMPGTWCSAVKADRLPAPGSTVGLDTFLGF